MPLALGPADGGGHAETERGREYEEHHHIGVGGGGQRAFAQQAPDPDRIDRSVKRLQNVRGQRRCGKQHQRFEDGAADQIAVAGCGQAISPWFSAQIAPQMDHWPHRRQVCVRRGLCQHWGLLQKDQLLALASVR